MDLNDIKPERTRYLKDAYMPLGLFGFAIPTFLIALFNMQAYGSTSGADFSKHFALVLISIVGLVLGGFIQFYAGLKVIYYGQLKSGSIFAIFGGFWIIFGSFHLIYYLTPLSGTVLGGLYSNTNTANNPPKFVITGYNYLKIAFAALLFCYATICMVSFYISLYKDLTISLIFAVLICAFTSLGISDAMEGANYKLGAQKFFQVVGGITSFLAGLGAIYLAWGYILSDFFKKDCLPVGCAPICKKNKMPTSNTVKKYQLNNLKSW